MTAPLANLSDLQDYMQSTSIPEDQAFLILNAASDAARGWTGQLISAVADDEIVLRGNDAEAMTLPEFPVTALASVIEMTTGEDDITGTTLVIDEDFYWTTSGVLRRTDCGTWSSLNRYQVTYDHGWDPVPSDVVLAVLQAASDVISQASSGIAAGAIESETIGDYSYRLGSGLSAAALQSITGQRTLLAPYRSQGVA